MAQPEFSTADLAKGMERVTDEVKREMGSLVNQAANRMVSVLQQRYPVGPTGNLRGMVRTTSPRTFSVTSTGENLTSRLVRASAPHVHMWQEGTRVRTDPTRQNANRGISPAHGKVFERSAAESRTEMLRQAQTLLDKNRDI